MTPLWHVLFGPGTWGAGGNLVAWLICGVPSAIAYVWHHRRAMRRQREHFSREIAALEERISRHPAGAPAPRQENLR